MVTHNQPQVITPAAFRLLATLGSNRLLTKFYLAGGTALALQLGHRKSIDLDFFIPTTFSTKKLKAQLRTIATCTIVLEEEDTLIVNFSGTKASFFTYRYPMLYALRKEYSAKLADIRDIACMKLDAVAGRGSKKDFVDLYFLLQQYSLTELLRLFEKKYASASYNLAHILKSLVYFRDADKEAMPYMFTSVLWKEVKRSIEQNVKKAML